MVYYEGEMNADAREFFVKAEESLASAEDDLTRRRFNSCANRAYYACFQAALAALLSAGIRPAGRTISHAFVQGAFVGQLVNRRKLYASRLRDTLSRNLDLRHTADYEPKPISKTQATRALQRAREFVDEVRPRGGEPE
jgi:uncharacterized protein (UPF0332 family)